MWLYRLGSRYLVNKTSQYSERYSDQMQAAMKQKVTQCYKMYLLMIEYPKPDWHAASQQLTTKGCATVVLRPELLSWTYCIVVKMTIFVLELFHRVCIFALAKFHLFPRDVTFKEHWQETQQVCSVYKTRSYWTSSLTFSF